MIYHVSVACNLWQLLPMLLVACLNWYRLIEMILVIMLNYRSWWLAQKEYRIGLVEGRKMSSSASASTSVSVSGSDLRPCFLNNKYELFVLKRFFLSKLSTLTSKSYIFKLTIYISTPLKYADISSRLKRLLKFLRKFEKFRQDIWKFEQILWMK